MVKEDKKLKSIAARVRAVLKKDTGAVTINSNLEEGKPNPFPFKSTAQMIADRDAEIAKEFDVFYRKQKSQWFRF